MWKEKPIFGFGLKSFRVKCWELLTKYENLSCATHPHNYYLELMAESGIVGLFIIIIFFLTLLWKSLIKLIKKNFNSKNEIYFFIPVLIIVFLEIWPIRTSGSFFTTWNATILWLNVGILFSLNRNKLSK